MQDFYRSRAWNDMSMAMRDVNKCLFTMKSVRAMQIYPISTESCVNGDCDKQNKACTHAAVGTSISSSSPVSMLLYSIIARIPTRYVNGIM